MKQKSNLFKTLGIMLLFVLFATQANAQNITVTGTVSDNLGPVIGASIQVEGTVKVILKARNWVMAKNHCSTAVLHFEILCDLNKLPQELVVIAPVMVPFNQELLSF